ncbi:MAG: TonB-dependent receptor [Chlorobiaceae bacterium]|nr:TonB-dependent receptor [Chlorobiaceae bacterium]NTW75016.1 TonB-dependent receptor [Chlorobiaceae bacterium]
MKQQHGKGSFLKRIVLSASFLSATMAPLTMYGAETGVLRGRVTDKTDGEGVVGASVVIAGTTIGTSTDLNGNFVIRNVPASAQKVTVSIIGYAPTTQTVNIGGGETTINFALGQTTIMASEVVVGAALYQQDRLDVPTTTNVVSREKIKQEANPTLDKLIEAVPGVVMTRAGGQTASSMQIRGSNTYQGGGIATRVNAFYDGYPINAPQSGEIVWQTASMNSADRIEVLKGAAATLYGSGAMGGVVNVIGHLADKQEVIAGSSIGFYDAPPFLDQSEYRKGYTPVFWSAYAGVGQKLGKFRYSLLYTHTDDDGYRKNLQYYVNDIKLKARFDIDATQYLQLSSFYNKSEGGYQYQWPNEAHAYDAYYSAMTPVAKYSTAKTIRENALVGLNYVKLFNDNVSLDTRVYYTRNGSRNEFPRNYRFTPPFTLTEYSSFNETYADRVGAGTKLDWRLSDQHRMLVGVDATQATVTSSLLFSTDSSFHEKKEKTFAAFLQDEWKITDKLTALGSVRYDWSSLDADSITYVDYTTPFSSLTPTNATITNKSVDAVSPRIALNYKAMDDLSFRASWGTSFRAPSIYERFVTDAGGYGSVRPNGSLNKETMTAYELGVYKQFGDKLSVDVAGFINDYKDLIESVQIVAADYRGMPIYQYQNIAKARIWGIEANVNYRPTQDWNINAAYTYMNAKNRAYVAGVNAIVDANPDPEWLPYRPEHTASAGVTWKASKKLSLNVNGRYVGKYKNISSETNKAGLGYPGDFVLFNMGTKYQFTKNISASLACNNINNTQYDEVVKFRSAGRSFVAGIDLTY